MRYVQFLELPVSTDYPVGETTGPERWQVGSFNDAYTCMVGDKIKKYGSYIKSEQKQRTA